MAPPAFDDDLSFSEGVEVLAIEQPSRRRALKLSM
jgi:hypothetical protein